MLLVSDELSKNEEKKLESLCSVASPSLPKLKLNKLRVVLSVLDLTPFSTAKRLLPEFLEDTGTDGSEKILRE